jgi:hypothetical protein
MPHCPKVFSKNLKNQNRYQLIKYMYQKLNPISMNKELARYSTTFLRSLELGDTVGTFNKFNPTLERDSFKSDYNLI